MRLYRRRGMTDRRTEILDAALRVLAEQGMRGLPHRAVDAAADIAAAAPGGLVDALVAVTVAMATTGRHRTLARYELSLASVREPQLRAALVGGGDVIRRLGARTLAAAGA